MKKSVVSAFVALSVLGVTSVSCKPKSDSSVNNLGIIKRNGASLRDNWKKGGCGKGAPETTAAAALMRAYSALPVALQLIFKPDDFKLAPFESVAKVCSAGLNAVQSAYPGATPGTMTRAMGSLDGCWVAENAKGPHGQLQLRPIVHLVDEPASVHNSMGVLATSAFLEFYVDGVLQNAQTLGISSELQDDVLPPFHALAAERAALTESLVTELGGTVEGRRSLDLYKSTLLPASRSGEGYSALAENGVFQNFVLAEMVDSYYCSPQTWATFGTEGLTQTRARLDEFAQRSFGFPWFGAGGTAGSQP